MERSRNLRGYYWNCHEQHAQLVATAEMVMSNMCFVIVYTSIDKPICSVL